MADSALPPTADRDVAEVAGQDAAVAALVQQWLAAGAAPTVDSTDSHAPADKEPAASETGDGALPVAVPALAPDSTARRPTGMLHDPAALDFALAFADRVVRPDDSTVATKNLERLAARAPERLPPRLRSAIRLGGTVGEALPWAVGATSKRVLGRMVGPLVADASPSKLGRTLTDLTADGVHLDLRLLGDPVLGEAGAARRLDGIRTLLARRDVHHVSLTLASVASDRSLWAFDETVERVAASLTPLYELALAGKGAPTAEGAGPATVITLDTERHRDRDLTIAVFQNVLSRPQLLQLEAGITVQTAFPDAISVMERLQKWAVARVGAGGAPITIRLGTDANLALERVDVVRHGPSVVGDGEQTDAAANVGRALDWALTPERMDAVRLRIAAADLPGIAHAWLLAESRGLGGSAGIGGDVGVGFEMPLGMPSQRVAAVRRTVGEVWVSVPVALPREHAAAVTQVLARLVANAPDRGARDENGGDETGGDENVGGENGSEGSGGDETAGGAAEHGRTPQADDVPQGPSTFRNAAGTDPALAANRSWARSILRRSAHSRIGAATIAASRIFGPAALEAVIASTADAGRRWSATPVIEREAVLRRAARALEANRDRLIEVMCSETGMIFGEGDSEVSRAVDCASYYATLTHELDAVDGARFVSPALVVVASSWSSPVATPAGGVLAALSVGGAVILKPAPEARRAAAVLAEVLWESGVPHELFRLVDLASGGSADSHDMGAGGPGGGGDADRVETAAESATTSHPQPLDLERLLIADPRVDRVVLSGSFETAARFRSWRRDLPLLAETAPVTAGATPTPVADARTASGTSAISTASAPGAPGGTNVIVVTPSADLDLAVSDIVTSAFGRAGQHPQSVSLAILVGSVGKSSRFTAQLVDAVTSLRVGLPDDPSTEVGPIIRPATEDLLAALTQVDAGERWLVEPRRVDESGSLWTPGVRMGVTAGSPFHLAGCAGPVLGIMHAATLDEAIELQNVASCGLAAGLQSLDADEVTHWLNAVEAGNLSINRAITGAVVRRQPYGGWKRASVGPGAKSGGPHALVHLGDWLNDAGAESSEVGLAGLDERVRALLEAATSGLDWRQFDIVRRAAINDETAWSSVFTADDVWQLGVERNVLRYRPVPVVIRLSEGEPLEKLVRVLAAGTRAQSPLGVSTALKLPRPLRALLKERRVRVFVEPDAEWLVRAAKGGEGSSRIRMIGGDPLALAESLGGSPDVAVFAGDATLAGRIELLAFVREQTVSMTDHRFGGVGPLAGVRID